MALIKDTGLFGNVSEDFIHKVAKLTHYNDQEVDLKNEDGSPNVDLILFLLGFNYNHETKKAVYEMLTEDVIYHRNSASTGVYVRNHKLPHTVRKMKVYSGNIRVDYPFKEIYSHGNILVGDWECGGEEENILNVGNPDLGTFTATIYHNCREDNTDYCED